MYIIYVLNSYLFGTLILELFGMLHINKNDELTIMYLYVYIIDINIY